MSICTRIVVAISFHQIDNTPNAKTCANSHNESLQNGNRLIKEFHILFSPDRRFDEYLRFQKGSGLAHLRCCLLLQFWLLLSFSIKSAFWNHMIDGGYFVSVIRITCSGSARTGGRVYRLLLIKASFLILVPVRSHPLHKGQILPW